MTTGERSNPVEINPSIQGPVRAITREILESYLNCEYKAHLKLAGHTGTPSDYEVLMKEIRAETLKRAGVKLAARYGGGEPLRDVRIDFTRLERGVPLILDGLIQDEGLSLRVDGLIRIDEPSRLGDFQYVPVLIHEREKIDALSGPTGGIRRKRASTSSSTNWSGWVSSVCSPSGCSRSTSLAE
jgi:hypothetical protein